MSIYLTELSHSSSVSGGTILWHHHIVKVKLSWAKDLVCSNETCSRQYSLFLDFVYTKPVKDQ